MPFDVQPTLDIAHAGPQVVIEARVAAEPPRPLTWRLAVQTRSQGGASNTTQAGSTDGANPNPLSTVTVNGAGVAELQVFEGERLVARERQDFGPPKP